MPDPVTATPLGPSTTDVPAAAQPRSQSSMALRRFVRHRAAMVSLILLILIFTAALLGGRIAPYGFDELTGTYSQPPSWEHPMGTDAIGHDLFSQVLRGAQKSIQVALFVAALSTLIGLTVGTIAGYYRGWIDIVLSRITDFVLVVPVLAVMMAAANALSHVRGNWMLIALLISVVVWPAVALVVRGSVLSLREQDFVQAAKAIGMSDLRIIVRHLVPNLIGPVVVSATLVVVSAILLESSLAFLGFGVSPPDTSLGKLVAVGQSASTTRPWLFYGPGLVLLLICLCANFVGDGLRDAFDPRQSRRRA